ncbi:helix-turn-helix domain-containing protein [Kocuria nitroreducens]|uniref:helix-turn-helix domain-containing protein n=1 Tax=Kocuria nitroreducens TaxID=3058914 RepID=UPI0036DC255E
MSGPQQVPPGPAITPVAESSMVLPTLFDPGCEHVELRWYGPVVLWRHEQRRPGLVQVLPDLCQDLVWGAGGPSVVPRTVEVQHLSFDAGAHTVGVRLPVGATLRGLPQGWSDSVWGDCRDVEAAHDGLRNAVETGALRWSVDGQAQRFLRWADQPCARIPQIAHALGMSERSLRRSCWQWFQANPVRVVRILRWWRFLSLLVSGPAAEAAAVAGYADQAHAWREVRALTGYRVGELARLHLAE